MEAFEQLWKFIVSPPVTCGVVWYIVKTYFGKQEALLTKLKDGMESVNLRIAIHEARSQQYEDGIKEISRIKDQQTLMQSRIDAAWRAIDKLGEERRNCEEYARLKERSG